MGQETSHLCFEKLCMSIMENFGPECLRKPTITDVEKLYAFDEQKYGFPGLLGSLDLYTLAVA